MLQRLRELRVDSAFIVMTGFGTVDTAVEAMKLGAVDFVQKPFFRDELLMRVRSAADRRGLARQVDLLQRQIRAGGPVDTLIGDSEPMRKVKDLIGRAAAAPGTVLVTGETGTGKELVARALHASSPRAEQPFVALNCAALTDSLLENELFGHARGAFTGAAAAARRPDRARQRRHALPRRDRHDAGGRAGQAAARARSGRSAAHRRERRAHASTSASSPRPTPICRPRSTPARSAAISSTASTCTTSTCRRCASVRGDVARLLDFFLERVGPPAGVTGVQRRRRARRSSPSTIRATCASSST